MKAECHDTFVSNCLELCFVMCSYIVILFTLTHNFTNRKYHPELFTGLEMVSYLVMSYTLLI